MRPSLAHISAAYAIALSHRYFKRIDFDEDARSPPVGGFSIAGPLPFEASAAAGLPAARPASRHGFTPPVTDDADVPPTSSSTAPCHLAKLLPDCFSG